MNTITEVEQAIVDVMYEMSLNLDLNKVANKEILDIINEVETCKQAIEKYQSYSDAQYNDEIAELYNYIEDLLSRINQ